MGVKADLVGILSALWGLLTDPDVERLSVSPFLDRILATNFLLSEFKSLVHCIGCLLVL